MRKRSAQVTMRTFEPMQLDIFPATRGVGHELHKEDIEVTQSKPKDSIEGKHPHYEIAYVTNHLKARMSHLESDIYATGYRAIGEFADAYGLGRAVLYKYIRGENFPSVNYYLRIGSALNWDLHRDINFIYRHKDYGYTQKDITRRIERIRKLAHLDSNFDYTPLWRVIFLAATDNTRLCAQTFAEGIFAIRGYELHYKLSNPIDVED